ncbi:response regulator transcription factor [Siphonobacter aquaeclarae]|uniref:Two component transcriptional regulator, LuxR family n=1 Tax=Siphonobacter aquaeclarae TaxID=563176 RepID=A0A1G9YKI8_9BACT|nr:response regulator transcription factor [Siphonobacter aquaeclarae]SDN09580.1 two component transcriptional regulator, LuxR family [Siphonobacter aquaeclarae]
MKRILIVEDHPIVATATTLAVSQYLPDAVCVDTNSFWKALELVETEPFDLVILDLGIPGGNSIQMIEKLRSRQPKVRILIFTGMEENVYALPFVKAGANGFLSKKASDAEFRRAIDTVLFRNKIYVSEDIHDLTLTSYFKPKKRGGEELEALSEREMEILQLLHARKGISEISTILNLSTSTVNTHRVRIFRKMGVDNLIDLVMKYEVLIQSRQP